MRTWIPRFILAAFAIMLAGAAYWGYRDMREPAAKPALSADLLTRTDRSFVEGFNIFGKTLYLEAMKEKAASGNIFLSPYSAAVALSMAHNGASGATADEIARALRYPSVLKEEINRSGKAIMDTTVQRTEQVELQVANSIWLKKGLSFQPDFLERNKNYYQSELQTVDFTKSSVPGQINGWVKKHTGGKIHGIVGEQIDASVVSILLNAVYFKGNWAKPFDERFTSDKPFTREDGSAKMVPMMENSGSYKYVVTEEAQAVRLPYGDGRLGMTFYVPGNKMGNVTELVRWLLDNGGLEKLNGGLQERAGTVAIPRFKLEHRQLLNDLLIRMGMKTAFNEQMADFREMTDLPADGKVFLSEVLQKTYVEVNEKGAEAAAVTKVVAKATSAEPPKERFRFEANRPFFFTIEDYESGLCLFMGTMMDPGD